MPISFQQTLKDPTEELIKWFQWSPAWKKKIASAVCEDAQPAPSSVQRCWASACPGRWRGTGGLWQALTWERKISLMHHCSKGYCASKNKKTRVHDEFESLWSCAGCFNERTFITYQSATVLQVNEKMQSCLLQLLLQELTWFLLWFVASDAGLCSLVVCEQGQEDVLGNSAAKEMSNNPLFLLHVMDL